jgi:hypothetical protein
MFSALIEESAVEIRLESAMTQQYYAVLNWLYSPFNFKLHFANFLTLSLLNSPIFPNISFMQVSVSA